VTREASPAPGTLHSRLRIETRTAHDALEGGLGLMGDISIDTYRHVLARFYGFWIGWQPQVAALLDDPALTTPRQRLHMLERDLLTLGLAAGDLAALPRCPLVDLRDDAESLGSLYVMEGSTLGGRTILQNVDRRLGRRFRAGRAYFSGYGEETGAMWRSFLVRLDRVPAAHMERVSAGAIATFERIAWWAPAASTRVT